MTDSLRGVRTRAVKTPTPRNAPVSTKVQADQVINNTGGYVFTIGDIEQAKRFLVLGSESNFYRAGADLSAENAAAVTRLAEGGAQSSRKLVDTIVEISTEGRAPKANPALFALAIAVSHGDDESKRYAFSQLPAVARTATHLFIFVSYALQFRSWGRAMRRAVAEWYTSKTADQAAFQVVKYQAREGFSHRDLFRLSHPVTDDAAFKGLGEWILRGDTSDVPRIVTGVVKARTASVSEVPALIREYGLSWEMVPTESLNEIATWDALLEKNLPLGALLRQLPRLTRIGFFAPFSDNTTKVVARLTDKEELTRARIHPISLLVAQKTYAFGQSERGSGTWSPVREIVDALDSAFYLAFKTIEPANKNTMIGVDVSGSMSWGTISGLPLQPNEVAGALALVTMATEPKTLVYGFGSSLVDLKISPSQRLDTVLRNMSGMNFGSTNPGALIQKAISDNIPVETFLVITDNEVNTGRHVFELLKKYRAKTGIPARMIVVGTTASRFSIADPSDSLSLDVAGFDSATPALIADFSRGNL